MSFSNIFPCKKEGPFEFLRMSRQSPSDSVFKRRLGIAKGRCSAKARSRNGTASASGCLDEDPKVRLQCVFECGSNNKN